AHEVPTEGDEIGREVGHAIRHADEPAFRDGGTVMQVGHEGDAVADEPGVQVAHWERDLGSLEPRALPPHKRRREALHGPAHPGFGEPLEHRRTPLPRRRVAPRMEEQPDHFATARETTSYTKRTRSEEHTSELQSRGHL